MNVNDFSFSAFHFLLILIKIFVKLFYGKSLLTNYFHIEVGEQGSSEEKETKTLKCLRKQRIRRVLIVLPLNYFKFFER